MEARVLQQLQHPTWIDSEKFARKPTGTGSGSVRMSRRMKEEKRLQVRTSAQLQPNKASSWRKFVSVEVSCCYKNFPASITESGSLYAPFDEAVMLKNKSQEILPYLNGRCIFLVGMMGSGKTTVGKVLSGVLGYSFFDSDTLVEQDMDGTPVADIFKLYGEGYFRDKEWLLEASFVFWYLEVWIAADAFADRHGATKVLQKLSLMHRFVVSTGGGAVTRPINWKYMHKGISVWLDVPLEALAQRIAAVGTDSRPLLHHESGDAYTKALGRLSTILEERGEAYANANARVSLEIHFRNAFAFENSEYAYFPFEDIAAKLGLRDVSSLSPATIALEALEEIEGYLKEEDSMAIAEF
ncbi:hypothetical protein JRO89_XS08G0034300 [Xanthoceras sorbifolium]|uniref:Shikimate kinase n=1 Tax=Xanthoceras sorbifolium TaxID=99658 RepID=A0ABQ8HNG8_9ROSI|nr:hypothetical protein JRO89_XS08G0034300 [Xanthoceras sorbifolium]